MRKYAVYSTVFFTSFCIFSLQVILAILFEVFVLSPYFSISLAFLGLSIAGTFSYVKYFKQDKFPSLRCVSLYFIGAGFLLLSYPFILKYSSLASLKGLQPSLYIPRQQILLDIFNNSLFIGGIFILIFFCLGMINCLIYKHYSDKATKLYFYDLIGGACGCIFSTIIFIFFKLSSTLLLLALLVFVFLAAASLYVRGLKTARIISFVFSLAAIFLLIINVRTDYLEPKLNPHFLLSDWNVQEDCKEIWHRWNIYSRISLVKHKRLLDSEYSYDFVINNGEGRANLQGFNKDNPYAVKLFDKFSPASLAFLSNKTPNEILILFAGAGNDMINAYSYSRGKSSITGVELNPLIVNKAMAMPDFHLSDFFRKDNIIMIVEEGRTYLERTDKLFDSIILANSEAGGKSYLGIPDYTGKFLYTKEAFVSYLKHLKPEGTIGIVSCNKINVIAMIKEAFSQLGYRDFFRKIIIFSPSVRIDEKESGKSFLNYNAAKVLVRNADFSREEVDVIKENILRMNQVLIYSPYYVSKEYVFFEQLIKAGDGRDTLMKLSKKYQQNFFVPTDNRPFVDQLASFNGIINLKPVTKDTNEAVSISKERGILFYSLILRFNLSLFVFAALFIFVPLVKLRKNINLRIMLYFTILGLSFIFAEIGIMQYFSLFLGSPIYSFSVIIACFLFSSGAGSLISGYFFDNGYLNKNKMAIIILLLLLMYFSFLPRLINYFLGAGLFLKLFLTICIISPLGMCLGVLYPQGLKRVYIYNKSIIPLVLAISGYMSIVASAFSPFLSWSFGFSSFLLISGLLYSLIAIINFRF